MKYKPPRKCQKLNRVTTENIVQMFLVQTLKLRTSPKMPFDVSNTEMKMYLLQTWSALETCNFEVRYADIKSKLNTFYIIAECMYMYIWIVKFLLGRVSGSFILVHSLNLDWWVTCRPILVIFSYFDLNPDPWTCTHVPLDVLGYSF